ncbi:ABC transporter permease [Dethiosulfatarculus sandiegensis]|uniref:ABC transporter permease n=1 Tax=Dethiosulfatarculus sandiegensis TaxID=1429043 RepID=A0A0D2JQ87_9BACT|nr:ABC transporter permease [Dethiosulfatarculus sandiegensis]KIX11655.1 ABC transporter permease [Dethiosulfatarculus sandiegensis]
MHLETGKKVLSDPGFRVGVMLAFLVLLTTILGPVFSPYDPWDISFIPFDQPSAEHILGVNDGGQDILSELLLAIRNSLSFGLVAGTIGLFLGVGLGLVSGWYGGLTDQVIMRVADVILAIPHIMILILVAALFMPSPWLLACILALMVWPTTAKAIRAQTLGIRGGLHVKAAVNMGAGGFYILVRHLLPEMFPLYLIGFAAKVRMAVFMEATLAILGLMPPDHKSLGMMINMAMKHYYMDVWWNWLAPPVVFLSLIIMSVTFLAISMEKVLDPRLANALPGGRT